MRESAKLWRQRNRARWLETHRRAYAKTKERTISHYGGVCCLCGIDDLEVLNIDHIKIETKVRDRKILGKKMANIYAYLIKHGFPKGYRVLCFNCNFKEYLRRLRRDRGQKQ